jgi:hypothetical protein
MWKRESPLPPPNLGDGCLLVLEVDAAELHPSSLLSFSPELLNLRVSLCVGGRQEQEKFEFQLRPRLACRALQPLARRPSVHLSDDDGSAAGYPGSGAALHLW